MQLIYFVYRYTHTKKQKNHTYEADVDDDRVVKEDVKKQIAKPKSVPDQYQCTCVMLLKNKSGVPYEMRI